MIELTVEDNIHALRRKEASAQSLFTDKRAACNTAHQLQRLVCQENSSIVMLQYQSDSTAVANF